MISRPNNPKIFAETVSLHVWRSKYQLESNVADLFVNLSFEEGRIGGSEEYPIRFRLALLRAEVAVRKDIGKTLSFNPGSVRHPRVPKALNEKHHQATSERNDGNVGISTSSGVEAKSSKAMSISRNTTRASAFDPASGFHVATRKDDRGYIFVFENGERTALRGPAWDGSLPALQISSESLPNDLEPAEPFLELRCRREDLLISDVQFKGKPYAFENLSPNKKAILFAYIKQQVILNGFHCEELADNPFAVIGIASAVPEVDHAI